MNVKHTTICSIHEHLANPLSIAGFWIESSEFLWIIAQIRKILWKLCDSETIFPIVLFFSQWINRCVSTAPSSFHCISFFCCCRNIGVVYTAYRTQTHSLAQNTHAYMHTHTHRQTNTRLSRRRCRAHNTFFSYEGFLSHTYLHYQLKIEHWLWYTEKSLCVVRAKLYSAEFSFFFTLCMLFFSSLVLFFFLVRVFVLTVCFRNNNVANESVYTWFFDMYHAIVSNFSCCQPHNDCKKYYIASICISEL